MLNRIIAFSLKNKLVVALLTMAMVVWGVYNFIQLPIDAVPDITNNQVQVITISPSLAPQEVEQFVTFPVEVAMANIQDVVEIRSISRFGLSVVTIVFKDQVDIFKARQRVSEQIKMAESQIPSNYGRPEMMPVTTGLGEIYQYVVEPRPGYEKVYSLYDLRTVQDWIIKRQLSGIPGIVDISTFGGWLKQYEVAVSPRKLVGMNITIPEIFEALEKNNQNSGGSYIEKRQNAYYIRTEGIVQNLGDIEKIVVKKISNIPITIGDIATVKIGAPPRFGAMTKDGKGEAVGGITLMLKGDNSSMVIARVKERMAKIQKMLPPGLEIKPYLDRSEMIRKTISTVTMNLLEGGLIVIFVLVLLLGNFRSGLVVASVIPLSMLFAISMMNIFGVSANLMSLGAIDFGLIVDGSVIVVEGIIHHLHKHYNFKKLTQEELDHTIYDASSRVGTAAVFGVIIILIVYVPIFAFTGIEGKMFKPMAQTVSFALVGALILSFTYVPMVSSLFLSKSIQKKEGFSDKIMNLLHRAHDRALVESLKRPVMVILVALIVVVVSFWIFTRMGGEFLPTLEEGDLACQMTLTPGTSLSQSIATTTKVEEILLKQFPEVNHVVSKIGSAEIPTDPMAIEDADIMITMKPQKEWTSAKNREEMSEKMKTALGVLPGVSFDFSQPIQLRFNELMTGVKSDVAVKIFGEDLNLLFEKATIAAGIISKIRGAGDVKVEQIVGLPQLVVRFNRDKIARYGLTINEVNSIIRTAFAGQAAGLVFEGEKRFDLVVRLDEEHRKNMDALMSLRVNKPNEELILLNQVADIEVISGPMQISREETRRRVTIGINVRNRDVESFIAEVNTALEKGLPLPPGYSFTYGGQFENLESAKRTSAIAVPVALAAIFILLFFAFGSIKQSAMIFSAIPLAAVGGIWSLLIRGMPFSISAGVGFIALFGIAVLNGIVLISHYNQLEKEGVTDVLQRVIQGTYDRLRPVVMTSLVAALGFLPMAISTAAGAEVQKPLATVVIGGILTSSFLTLVLLPVLYLVFNAGFSCFLLERFRKKPPLSGSTAIILLLLFSGGVLQAQEKNQPVVLTMEDAVQCAVKNSTEFKTFELQKLADKKLIKSAFNLNSPVLSLETGQINSSLNDYKLLISQNFEFPLVYAYQVSAQKSRSLSTEKLVSLKQQEMVAQVRSTYMKWWISKAKTELLRRQDSLFRVFSRAVASQQSAGETGRLSAVIADSRQARVEGRLRMSEAESDVLSNDLTVLIHSSTAIALPSAVPERLILLPFEGFSSDVSSLAQYYDHEIRYSRANLRAESWKLAPSFSIGWFTQSIDETEPFTGMQYGISLPIWLWAPVGRIQSAKLHREIAVNDRENSLHHLNARLFQLNRDYNAASSRLDWFEQKGAGHAGTYIEIAIKSFEAGETDLFESVLMLNEAFDLQMDYLDALNAHNQLVISINQILGR